MKAKDSIRHAKDTTKMLYGATVTNISTVVIIFTMYNSTRRLSLLMPRLQNFIWKESLVSAVLGEDPGIPQSVSGGNQGGQCL